MKVKELIKKLQKYDIEKEVIVAGNNKESPCEITRVEVLKKNFRYYNPSEKDIDKIIIDND